ncbi:MAG: NBR1-Ig-like domain-containing protein, partial [Anaerolineaceae bacterium]
MKRIYLYLAVVFSLAIGLWISACNMPGSSTSPQISPLATSTAIMNEVSIPETLQAFVDATQTASSPAQDVTPTPSPSATPVPTITQTSTPTEVCFDKAEFVKDITVPDGTLFSPGDEFVKTWRLRNVGTCTWTELYQLVFVGGDPMGGASSTPLSEVVPQGETIDLSISL